jgi:archaemetzincin
MNGSNHLAESDRRPLHLCPVDLRKLHWSLDFDIMDRYRRLLAFWREAGVDTETRWIERRLEFIERRSAARG